MHRRIRRGRGLGPAAWLAAAALTWLGAAEDARGVSSDRADGVILATGLLDETTGVEAVYYLDTRTGALKAAVPSIRTRGSFQSMWERNVNVDLLAMVTTLNAAIKKDNASAKRGVAERPEIQVPQTPKYAMVTGALDLRQGAARLRPGRSVIYVAEASTGIVLAYFVPWSASHHSSDQPYRGQLELLAGDQFSYIPERPEE